MSLLKVPYITKSASKGFANYHKIEVSQQSRSILVSVLVPGTSDANFTEFYLNFSSHLSECPFWGDSDK